MKFYRRKRIKKVLVPLAILLMAVFFCATPKILPSAYAGPFDNPSSLAVLPKDNFGILRKINGVYYLLDRFENPIDIVIPTRGVNLDKYLGKSVLVKDNIFAGLAESPARENKSFVSIIRGYLSGLIPAEPIKPIGIDPAVQRDPADKFRQQPKKDKPLSTPIVGPGGEKIWPIDPDPIAQPMYGVIGPVPMDPPPTDPVVQPMYGVIGPIDPLPIDPGPIVQPMYGVIGPIPQDPPPTDPIAQPMYGVIGPIDPVPPIDPGPIVQPMYGVIGPVPMDPPPTDPVVQPMYGVIGPVEPGPIIPDPGIHVMYGGEPIIPDPSDKIIPDPGIHVMYGGEPIILDPTGKIIPDPTTDPVVQPMYGVIGPVPMDPPPTDPIAQPMYGVIGPVEPRPVDPGPIAQPMYGVYIDPLAAQKTVIMNNLRSRQSELSGIGIKITSQMNTEQNPLRDFQK